MYLLEGDTPRRCDHADLVALFQVGGLDHGSKV
jgi:hypothetical protein